MGIVQKHSFSSSFIYNQNISLKYELKIQTDNINNNSSNQSQLDIQKKLYLKFYNAQPLSLTGDQGLIVPQNDQRLKLEKMKYPFSAIGHLRSIFPKNSQGKRFSGWGTGFLIHDNIVLTCAHNVYNKSSKSIAQYVQFRPGLHGKIQNKYIDAGIVYIPNQYKTINNQEEYKKYDYAMLVLYTTSLANKFGYLGINQDEIKNNQQLIIFGYPKDLNYKDYHHNQENNQENELPKQVYQFGCSGKVVKSDQKRVYYEIDTTPGQSGSPILRVTKKGYYQVVGIHSSSEIHKNIGIKITMSLLFNLNKWIYIEQQTSQKKIILSKQKIYANFVKNRRKVKHKNLKQANSAINIIYDQKFIYLNNQKQIFKIGIMFYYNYEHKKSIFMLQKYLQIIKEKYGKSHKNYLESLIQLAIYYGQMECFQESQKLLLQSIQLIQKEKINCHKTKSILYYALTLVNIRQKKLQIAMQYNSQAIESIQKVKEIDNNFYNQWSINQFTRQIELFGQLNKSQEYLDSSSKLLKLLSNIQEQKPYLIANIFSQIGKLFQKIGNNIQKFKYYKKSLQKYQQLIEKDGLFRLEPNDLRNIGQIYKNFQQFQKAEKYFKQALKLYQNIWGQDYVQTLFILKALGSMYRLKGNYITARMCLEKSYKIFCQNYPQDQRMGCIILSQLGQVYAELKNNHKAIEFLQKSIAFRQNQYGKQCYQCISELSILAIILSYNKKECQKVSKKIFRILQNHGYQHSNISCILFFVFLWRENLILKQLQKSVKLYKRINQIQNYNQIKNNEIKYNINHILRISFFYFQLCNFKKGLKYLIKYRDLVKKGQLLSISLSEVKIQNLKSIFKLQSIQKIQ